jgi:hypothetical protein
MIKIEVTGNSIPEVADKLLAIGASLRGNNGGLLNSAAHPVGNVHVSEDADINPAALTVVEVEVAEAAPVDPTPAPKSAEAAVGSESQPTTTEPSSTPAPAASASEPLNFELDVAPVVLRAVAAKGKPFVQDVLSEFGGVRASDLDDALWPELIARLEAEIA